MCDNERVKYSDLSEYSNISEDQNILNIQNIQNIQNIPVWHCVKKGMLLQNAEHHEKVGPCGNKLIIAPIEHGPQNDCTLNLVERNKVLL